MMLQSPMQLPLITQSLVNGIYLSKDLLSSNVKVGFLARTWVWLKKIFHFSSEFRLSNVAQAILNKLIAIPSTSYNKLLVARELHTVLAKKIAHSKDPKASSLKELLKECDQVLKGKLDPHLKMIEAIKRDGLMLATACEDLKSNKTVVLSAVADCGKAFVYANPVLKEDKEIARAAIAKDCTVLLDLSESLTNDPTIVLCAIKLNYRAISYAGKLVLEDRAFLLKAIKINPSVYDFFTKEQQAERELCLAVVQGNGALLYNLPVHYREDQEVVLAAVETCGYAFTLAGATARAYKPIVLTALKQLKSYKSLAQLDLHPVLSLIPDSLINNPDVISAMNSLIAAKVAAEEKLEN